jgi:parallel beta-helix repeat protein
MKEIAFWAAMLTILINGTVKLTFSVQLAETTGTIYIKADGLVEPSTAPIQNIGNHSYMFTSNINGSIVVERDNIMIDGACYSLQGTRSEKGIDLTGKSNITIKNLKVTKFYYGFYFESSSNITLSGNNMADNYYGVALGSSWGNNLFCNNVLNNTGDGFFLFYSDNNILYGNTVLSNERHGIALSQSGDNKIFHNNFINNTKQTHLYESFNNMWDDDYPSGGNYWSDGAYVDLYSGRYQNESGSDGIGDSFYTINVNDQDRFPLMAPISPFDVGEWNGEPYFVEIVSNSTVSNFQLSVTRKILSFSVTCETGSGFCRVTIPNAIAQNLWKRNCTILVDSETPLTMRNWTDDETYTYIYFTYFQQEHEVVIVPEFSSPMILSPLMVSITTAVVILKRRHRENLRNRVKTRKSCC